MKLSFFVGLLHLFSSLFQNIYSFDINICQKNCVTLPKFYSNFTKAIDDAYSELVLNTEEKTINFFFHNDYFVYSDDLLSSLSQYNAFEEWEIKLQRKLKIMLIPFFCVDKLNCQITFVFFIKSKFLSIFATSEFIISNIIFDGRDLILDYIKYKGITCYNSLEGCCNLNNFKKIGDDCYLDINLRNKISQMVFLNFSIFDSNSIIKFTEFKNFLSVNNDFYLNSLILINNSKLNILDSEFSYIYVKSSLISAFEKSNIIISNSKFIDYNPWGFYESSFSYLFLMGKGVLGFSSLNNTFKMATFIINSNSKINIFENNLFDLLPTNTFNKLYDDNSGIFKFGPTISCEIRNSTFSGKISINNNFLSKMILFYIEMYTNILIDKSIFKNFWLQEGTILKLGNYNNLNLTNTDFININHTCNENPSDLCVYPIIKIDSYNNIKFQNLTFNTIYIKSNIGLIIFNNFNKIFWTIISFRYTEYVSEKDSFISFGAFNQIDIKKFYTKVMVFPLMNTFLGLGAFNNFMISSSYFSNNSTKPSRLLLIFGAVSNTILLSSSSFIKFETAWEPMLMLLNKNSLTWDNCQIYNIKAVYGSIIMIEGKQNEVIFNNSLAQSLLAEIGGGFLYSMGSNTNFKILNSILVDSITLLQGGLIYFEKEHSLIMKNSILFKMESQMTGGVIVGISSNSFEIYNTIILSSMSLSNGGFIHVTQKNIIKIYNSTINNSLSTNGQGGILYAFQTNIIEMINNNFLNCNSEQEGGSFFIDYKNSVILKDSYIYNTKSKSDGGFLFLKQDNNISANNITINISYASFSAGFIKAQKNNTIEMNYITAELITSLKEGGLYYIDINNRLIINNNNGKNIFSEYGSVLCSSIKNIIEMNNNNFSNIDSNSNGGALFFSDSNNVFINNIYIFKIDSGRGNGAFIYASNNNILNLTLINITKVQTKSKGGLFYLKNNNIINMNSSVISNITAFEDGCVIFTGLNNVVYFMENLIYLIDYFNAFLIEESNKVYLKFNVFNVKSAGHHKYFLQSDLKNTFDSEFDQIKFENSDVNSIILFFSMELNEFKLVNTKIFMDVCQKYFLLYSRSILYIDYFMLNGFHSDFSEALIDIENSKFTLLAALVKNSKFKTFLNSINSNISINNAFFSINFPYTNLIIMANSNLSIFRSIFKNKKNNILMNIIEGTNSKLILNLIDVISFYSYPIGSAISITNSNLTLHNSFLSFNKAQFSTILSIKFTDTSKIFSINLKKNIFLENKGKIYAGIMYIDSLESIQIITNLERNNILFNQASRGAVIKTNYVNSLLFNFNKFSKNSAPSSYSSSNVNRSKGGVLYSSKLKNLKLISNSFMKNKAEIGGIIYFDDPIKNNLLIQNSKNKFENNLADYYGNEFTSSTIKLRFFSLEKNLINSIFHLDSYIDGNIGQIRSGIEYNDCQLKINGYDYFNQITYNTDENFLSDYKHVSLTNASNNIFFPSIRSGFICFNHRFLRDSFPITGAFKYELLFPSFQREKLNLVLEFTNCNVGERLTEDLSCSPCPKSLYNFQQDFSKLSDVCKNCDNENFYCFGGGNITIKPGYWRIAEDSYEFYRCPNKYACLGDPRNFSNLKTKYIPIYSASNCDVGYKGILCSECDDNYGFLDGHYCSSCDNQNYYLQVISNIIIRLIFTMYLISVSINMCLSLMSENPKTSRILASNLLKILTNHIQILGIISALPISFPSELKSVSDYLMNISPNVSEAFSIECLLKSMNLDLSLQYFKMCFSGIYPLLIVLFFILFIKIMFFITNWVNNKYKSSSMKISTEKNISISSIKIFDLIYTVLILVFLICYADISKMTFAMFGCVDIGDGNYKKKLLFSDFRIDCDSSYHKKWILQAAMPLLIFFLIAYPSLIIYKISKSIKKKKHEHSIFSFTYGYFFYSYKEKYFYWDFIILARKLILIFINSYFFSRVTDSVEIYPILIVGTIISLSLLIQIYFKPFEEKFGILNKIEEVSLIVSYFCLSIALFYMISNDIESSIILFLFFVAVFLNSFFFLYWIKIYYQYYFKEKIAKIFTNISLKKSITGKKIIVKDLQKVEIKEKDNMKKKIVNVSIAEKVNL